MSKLIKALEKKQTVTTTENGAKTFSSSLNRCLDFFFMAGAMRKRSDDDIITLFTRAYNEDKELALKILAYARDCRGGMGERRLFRVITKYLAESGQDVFHVFQIPEIGRWDDVLNLLNTPLKKDVTNSIVGNIVEHKNALCAKWMPRQGHDANTLRQAMSWSPKQWRKSLVDLTKVVETQMCNKEWPGINYSHVPSVANIKYNKAFLRNDETRRREFLGKAVKGEVKINSSVAFPNDIVRMSGGVIRPILNQTAEAMWKQLPNYLEGSSLNMMVMADTSGSMQGTPLEISVALALYISERSEGLFKNAYMTFDNKPQFVYTKGSLYERLRQMPRIHPANTNLEAGFELLLETAHKNKLSNSDLPTHLLIISDMEFDQACRKPDATLYKSIRKRYKDYGYDMPNIIFWNVNSRQNNVPVRQDENGVGLVSGSSPAAIKAVLSGNINPVDIMIRAVDTDRYKAFIK